MGKNEAKAIDATAEVFSMAFDKLGKEEKIRVIEKIFENPSIKKTRNTIILKLLDNPEIMEDLYDIALIEESKKVKGKYVPLREYLKKKKAR